ncbi:uncharacterized protein [Temnothorax longispinosus]|uniref:uncharacterized protein n=1 Tax=Temnothorax longispinosus TaxID=300112 RepID=UPI003A997B6D
MVKSPISDYCPAVDVEESDKLMEPVLPLSSENTNHYIIDIPISCEIEVRSTSNLCNASVNQSIEERASCPKAKPKLSQNKTFVNAATQTILKNTFTIDTFGNKPDAVMYYTGLESLEKFKLVLYSLGPAAYELKYRYDTVSNISVEDQFFITLIKLRRAIPDLGLAYMFDVSKKTIQNIVITWICFMYCQWSEIDIWPSKDLIMYYMPSGFKQMYPSTRVIVDGTEFPIAAPTNSTFKQATFSTYKNKTTLKVLVGATPSGLISHISPAYAGSVSDRAIVERSDLIKKCDPGDSVMADRGFTVQDLFAPSQVSINIPAFLKGRTQLPGMTLLKDRKLASKRVHIERLIGLTKTYKILKTELPVCYVTVGSEIFYVCCILCNFRENIVSADA